MTTSEIQLTIMRQFAPFIKKYFLFAAKLSGMFTNANFCIFLLPLIILIVFFYMIHSLLCLVVETELFSKIEFCFSSTNPGFFPYIWENLSIAFPP